MTTTDSPVDLAAYSAALEEIYRLRCALAYEALINREYLTYATLPKSIRREIVKRANRMHDAARGRVAEAYAGVDSYLMQELMEEAGASPTLTRAQWEAGR